MLSVKEHPGRVLLGLLPKECDIICTHPMFDSDSGKIGWHDLNFVYECTHKYGVIFDPTNKHSRKMTETYSDSSDDKDPYFIELIPKAFN